MSDPTDWPALRGALIPEDEPLCCELGVWGKVPGLDSDYRWIARTPGFDGGPDLDRRLRIGGEDLPVRACAWRAPGASVAVSAPEWFAVGLYPSRARDAVGRAAVLEKWVLQWRRPAGLPAALGALALLPEAAAGDDRCWWDRAGGLDWRRPDAALRLAPADAPAPRLSRVWLAAAVAAGIAELTAALPEPRLAAIYAALLDGQRPVLIDGLGVPLPPRALAALLLPLGPAEAAGRSLCAWVPATLVDPADLGLNWDLAVTGRAGPGQTQSPPPTPAAVERGARLAAALFARDPVAAGPAPAPIGSGTTPRAPGARACSGDDRHPDPRLQLDPADGPGLAVLGHFAERVNLRRLDLPALARDLWVKGAWPPPGATDEPTPDRHPLIGWISVLEAGPPPWVPATDWDFKIDQLRSAALVLLPHPRTLDLVGLPRDPRVPALLAVLALPPGPAGPWLAGHGAPALERLVAHTRACPDAGLVEHILGRM